jgi:hypothetical protein
MILSMTMIVLCAGKLMLLKISYVKNSVNIGQHSLGKQ